VRRLRWSTVNCNWRTLAAMFCGAGRRRHAARASDGQTHRRLATRGWGLGPQPAFTRHMIPEVRLPGVPTGTRAEHRCQRAPIIRTQSGWPARERRCRRAR
jgi:hypothetical protein